MHFWIDKRSQACGFNGRHRVPASLSAGRRRRSKPMVTPVHRFQAIGSVTIRAGSARRARQQPPHSRPPSLHHLCLTPVISNGQQSASRPPHPTEEAEVPLEGSIDTAQHAQLMRLGGRIKYGMWASFALTTLSVAATKFYVDHQGTGVEVLMLCALGILTLGLLLSCVLSVCRAKTAQRFIQSQAEQQRTGIEIEIPEPLPRRNEVILEVDASSQPPVTLEPLQEPEQPPPPYHIAILLPPKNSSDESPPPTYDNAVR